VKPDALLHRFAGNVLTKDRFVHFPASESGPASGGSSTGGASGIGTGRRAPRVAVHCRDVAPEEFALIANCDDRVALPAAHEPEQALVTEGTLTDIGQFFLLHKHLFRECGDDVLGTCGEHDKDASQWWVIPGCAGTSSQETNPALHVDRV
jgi:hypothetical protein